MEKHGEEHLHRAKVPKAGYVAEFPGGIAPVHVRKRPIRDFHILSMGG